MKSLPTASAKRKCFQPDGSSTTKQNGDEENAGLRVTKREDEPV
jgi:hypothetical protein